MLDAALIHPKEVTLKPIVFGFSVLVWALVVLSLIGACYGLILLPFVLIAQAYFLGHVRGTGVRVDSTQLPDLHRRVVLASKKLKLEATPEVYVLQSGGILNAFATKLFSRNYVILFSELLDKCNSDEEVDFIVAHELGHHAAGHLKNLLLTAPARLVPLLGPAYSRACEYTCDRAGLFAVGSLEGSQRAFAVLAAGSKAGAMLDLRSLALQQETAGEFWPAVAELSASHPFLPKRVAMLASWEAERTGAPRTPPAPGRPFFSYILAIFFGQQAIAVLVFVYLFAILAAVAIPNFMKFRERAQAAQASSALQEPPVAAPEPETAAQETEAPQDETDAPPDEADDAQAEAPAPEPISDAEYKRQMRKCLGLTQTSARTSCVRALIDQKQR